MTVAAVVDRAASGPYRYLDYFQDNDSDRLSFAGRDDDIAEVAARASSDDPFVLYGRSGLGKTSLLLAGVFPLLRDRRLHPIRVRVFDRPDVDLRNALAAELELDSRDTAHDLNELVARLAGREGLVLVFDQFEELFINTRRRPAIRREFIHLLATLVRNPEWDVRLTLSLREEFLAELDEFRDDFPDILSNQYRLLPLTAFGARQAIVAPLVHSNIPFDQELVVRLVDLLAKVDFDPVLLQIACGEVYREAVSRQADRLRLTADDLDRVGGINGLFSRYLDNAIRGVPEGILLLSRAVLDALITPEETKRAITFDALLANDDFNASIDELEGVLECLKTQKLVRDDLRAGHLWYELTHDRLAPSIVKWFKRDVDFAQFRDARDLIAEAARRAAYPARLETLIGRPQIDGLINPYRQRLRLTTEQRALMLWSALYGQVEHVEFWAALAGEAPCEDALRSLIEHSAPEARLGAARAAARLPARMPAVAEACVTRALDDTDAGVRQAAAVALSRHAGDDQIAQIRNALRSRRLRWRALDVLATFAETGGPIDRFGRIARTLARWHARRRTLAANRNAIIARGRRGVLVGFLASAAWTATFGLLMASVSAWAAGEISWLSTAMALTGVAGAVAAVAGVAAGWWLGRSSAKRAAIKGLEGRWGSVIVRVTITLFVVAGLALGGVAMIEGSELGLIALGVVTAAVAVCLVLSVYASIMRAVVWPPAHTGLRQRVAWTFLMGLPIAVPIAMASLVQPAVADTLWIAAGVAGALTTIVMLVLSETAAAFPIALFPPLAVRARQIGRGLLLAAAAAAAIGLWFTFGTDSLPFAARTFNVDAGGRIPVHLQSGVDSSYFRIETADESSRWFVARPPAAIEVNGASTRIFTTSFDGDAYPVVHIPPGQHLLSAITRTRQARSGDFELHAIPHLTTSDDPVDLSGTRWKPFVLRLDELPPDAGATRLWRAELQVRINRGGPKPASATLWIRPLVEGAAFDLSAGALKERLITFRLPQPLRVFMVPDPPAKASAYNAGRDMQPFEIDSEGRARLLVTYRGPQAESARAGDSTPPSNAVGPGGSVVYLPVGLKLVESFDWQRDWDDAAVLEDAANEFLLNARLSEGIELLKRVAELKPGDPSAQNAYAWTLVTASRGSEGLDAARRAVELSNRKNAALLDTLAHTEYESGNWAEAIKAWEEMLVVDPAYYKPAREPFCEKDQTLLDEARRRVRPGA